LQNDSIEGFGNLTEHLYRDAKLSNSFYCSTVRLVVCSCVKRLSHKAEGSSKMQLLESSAEEIVRSLMK